MVIQTIQSSFFQHNRHRVEVLIIALLISSYTCGIAIYYMRKEKEKLMLIWMIITVLLGIRTDS
jgi:heme/copper-type cytochrome/quinol oxidase subunit 3